MSDRTRLLIDVDEIDRIVDRLNVNEIAANKKHTDLIRRQLGVISVWRKLPQKSSGAFLLWLDLLEKLILRIEDLHKKLRREWLLNHLKLAFKKILAALNLAADIISLVRRILMMCLISAALVASLGTSVAALSVACAILATTAAFRELCEAFRECVKNNTWESYKKLGKAFVDFTLEALNLAFNILWVAGCSIHPGLFFALAAVTITSACFAIKEMHEERKAFKKLKNPTREERAHYYRVMTGKGFKVAASLITAIGLTLGGAALLLGNPVGLSVLTVLLLVSGIFGVILSLNNNGYKILPEAWIEKAKAKLPFGLHKEAPAKGHLSISKNVSGGLRHGHSPQAHRFFSDIGNLNLCSAQTHMAGVS